MTTSAHPPLPTWDDQVPLLIDLAVADLAAGLPFRPTLVAFRGDDPLFIATLRDFARGCHGDAILEVGALAMGLSADRVLLSLTGRAWSTQDPIPPVLADGPDLRQQVLVLHRVDACDDDPLALSTIIPIDVDPQGEVATGPALSDVAADGLVPRMLQAVVQGADDLGPDLGELGLQIRRCERLGHQLAWSPTVTDLVQRARLADLCGEAPGQGWDRAA